MMDRQKIVEAIRDELNTFHGWKLQADSREILANKIADRIGEDKPKCGKCDYYYLKEGDIIQEGDEVDMQDGRWEKALLCIGEKAPNPAYTSHRHYRRECDCKDDGKGEGERIEELTKDSWRGESSHPYMDKINELVRAVNKQGGANERLQWMCMGS